MKTNSILFLLFLLFLFIGIVFHNAKAQLPNKVLVGYWHNWESLRIKDVNDNYNVIMLSFMETTTGLVSGLAFNPNNKSGLKADVPIVQAKGKKVVLSIGGAAGSFKLSSDTDKNTFVTKVKTVIQEYGLDGIDIDVEGVDFTCNPSGTLANPDPAIQQLINGCKELLTWFKITYGRKMILTCAPEAGSATGGLSPWNNCGGTYLPFIEQLREDLDLVMIQLYNSGSLFSVKYPSSNAEYYQGTEDFVISQTEAMIKGFKINNPKISGTFSGIPASKIAVALPSKTRAGSGYLSPEKVTSSVKYLLGCGPKAGSYTLLSSYPDLRGLMTWSINNDALSEEGVYSFAETFKSIFITSGCLHTEVSPIIKNTNTNLFKLYPNPASGYIVIETDQNDFVSIVDLSGSQVLTECVNEGKNTIDISLIPAGIYCLSIGNLNQKFVKYE